MLDRDLLRVWVQDLPRELVRDLLRVLEWDLRPVLEWDLRLVLEWDPLQVLEWDPHQVLEWDPLRVLGRDLLQSNLHLLQGLHPRNILLFGQMGGWACWSARLRLYQTYRKSRVTNPMIDYQSSQARQSQSTLHLAASYGSPA